MKWGYKLMISFLKHWIPKSKLLHYKEQSLKPIAYLIKARDFIYTKWATEAKTSAEKPFEPKKNSLDYGNHTLVTTQRKTKANQPTTN